MQINMPFKPKAQILLQLGEQLIKSESVAILELIKNAYDADATLVTVRMNKIDNPASGIIEIADNGSGMSIDTVTNIWMEPGNTHKKAFVDNSERSQLGRLPIGEKGIGRFGVHKLGKKIEMITRSQNAKEICVKIDWRAFENAKYLKDVQVTIEERDPLIFTDTLTGTKLLITDLSSAWTRGMLRNVYRAITSLSSPFNSIDAFRVNFSTDKREWLAGLLTFKEIKQYALYTCHLEISGQCITRLEYKFSPFDTMFGLKPRSYNLTEPVKMVREIRDYEVEDSKKKTSKMEPIDLGKYKIGKISIDLMVFDRDSAVRARYIADKKTYGSYLDENGGIRVFRDGVRIYDYGEPGNDWLGFDIKRVNTPGKYLSNNLVLGAVQLSRKESEDLREKANREGFIENAAYIEFHDAIAYAINCFTVQRNIDKENLRIFLGGGKTEPVTHDVSEIRKKIAVCVPDEKARKEIDTYLKKIETDFDHIQKMYLKTASAGMSYGVVIHEIEKVISELNTAVVKENSSAQITNLAKHLARLVDSYAELLRNRSKTNNLLLDMITQSIFSLQYRLDAHKINVEIEKKHKKNLKVFCAANLIVGSIINIIDNSIWWTTYAGVPEKYIYIKATDEIEGKPAIVIADNGCGFALSPEDAIKPFVSMKPNGMGLGLNIVNEIILSQGGTLLFPDRGDIELPDRYKNGAIIALVFKED